MIADTLRGFVLAQTNYWLARKPGYAACLQRYHEFNEARDDYFLFSFCEGGVDLVDKPGRSAAAIETSADGYSVRAMRYLRFFRLVLAYSGRRFDGVVAMSMHDIPESHPEIPFFGFQKTPASRAILLPDVDAITWLFYRGLYDDTRAYEEKQTSAIFIGATTGARHTGASVAALSNRRLRSGVYFRDQPLVDFRLPQIVQCASPEAEQAIRDLGFGVGSGDWTEQLEHRFLISMDGNGATCSRVAIALKSNSVLLKYQSDHLLYYFSALIPYQHYIPISRDEDVVDAIAAEARRPGLYEAVARNGQAFYETLLSPEPTLRYTEHLLASYFSVFEGAGQEAQAPTLPAPLAPALYALAHVQDHGAATYFGPEWLGVKGSGCALEGVSILTVQSAQASQLQYRACGADGQFGDWLACGALAGGHPQRLHGFAVRLAGDPADFKIRLHGRFIDGEEVGPFEDDAPSILPAGQPLEAVRIEISPRRSAAPPSDAIGHLP